MGISIEQVNNAQKQRLIQKFSLSKQVFLQDRKQQLGTPTFLNLMLPPHKLASLFIGWIVSAVIVSVIVSIPLID
jgi:hypothetical protein